MASVSLDSPDIRSAYEAVSGDSQTDWLLLGYRGTRSSLFLQSTGSAGVVELQTKLVQTEVQFGLLKLEGRSLLFTFLPDEGVSGVQRARALVHSRAVGAAFRHDATFTAASPSELQLATVRNKLRLDSSVPPSPIVGQSPYGTASPAFSGPYISSPLVSDNNDDRPPPPPASEKPLSPPLNGMANLGIRSPRFESPPDTPSSTYSVASPATSSFRQQQSAAPSTARQLPPRSSSFTDTVPAMLRRSVSPTLVANGLVSASRSPRPQDEWRTSETLRTSGPPSASSSPPPPTQEARRESSSSIFASTPEEPQPSAADLQLAAEKKRNELEASRRGREEQAREDTHRLERERREREAAERAREAAEKDARAKWEYEQREREKLETEERMALEREERDRREAADRLRREETRRAEEKERVEREKLEKEEAERTRAAKEEMKRLIEKERLEKKARDEEEARRKQEEKDRARIELIDSFRSSKEAGETMLRGEVSVQGGASLLWKRRYFELDRDHLTLYKSASDTVKPIERIKLPKFLRRIIDNPEEAAMPNSFQLALADDNDFFFYTDRSEDKQSLVAGITMSAEL